MKVSQSATLSPQLLEQSKQLGQRLARLRLARRIKQTDAAVRAGLSRNTVYRLERGDPGLAIGQVLRYLDAIAPGSTLLARQPPTTSGGSLPMQPQWSLSKISAVSTPSD